MIEFDKDAYKITNVDEVIFWSFDSFLAQLLVKAAEFFTDHPKYSLFDSEMQMEAHAGNWRDRMDQMRKTFLAYEDADMFEREQILQSEQFAESFETLQDYFSHFWW